MERIISMTCWPCGDSNRPCISFDLKLKKGEHKYGRRGEGYDRLDREASDAGWVIGHINGQSYYACPDHAGTLFDPVSLCATRPRRARGGVG